MTLLRWLKKWLHPRTLDRDLKKWQRREEQRERELQAWRDSLTEGGAQ